MIATHQTRLARAEQQLELERRIGETRGEWRHLLDYRDDPIGYAREVLGMALTPDQEETLVSIRDNRRTAVKASHAIGKTHVAAVAANWWYDTQEQSIAYITAPTWPQAKGLTFKQIRLQRRRQQLPGDILETGLVRDPDPLQEPGHFIRALNAETGEGFQGEHTSPILIVIEEGPGVPHYIWEASDGLMTVPECRLLAIGNPTDEATDFGLACASPLYQVLSVSALNHPNITAELQCQEPPLPKAVRLLWLREMLEKEAEQVESAIGDSFKWWSLASIDAALDGRPVTQDSEAWHYLPTAVFQGRVLGEFPTAADEKVIPRGWVTNLPPLEAAGVPEIGCDPARFGNDRTAIAVRRGPCLLSVRELRQMDLDAVLGALVDEARQAAALAGVAPKTIPIHIDVTGGLGAGPADALKAQGYTRVDPVNSSERASDPESYPNVRSELWFTMRERARTKDLDLSQLPRPMRDKLVRELSTPTYRVDGRGHRVVEPKDRIKARLGESSDLADAVNLAFRVPGRGWFSDPTTRDYILNRPIPLLHAAPLVPAGG